MLLNAAQNIVTVCINNTLKNCWQCFKEKNSAVEILALKADYDEGVKAFKVQNLNCANFFL